MCRKLNKEHKDAFLKKAEEQLNELESKIDNYTKQRRIKSCQTTAAIKK